MLVKIGIIQLDIHLGEINRNVTYALSNIQNMVEKGVRLIVLPELWTSGFDYKHLAKLAENTPKILQEVQQIITANTLVIGTLPEIKKGKLYNTAFLIDKTGLLDFYQKSHLFTPSGEDKHFTPGKKLVVTPSYLGKIGVLICYDLRFPEIARCLTLKGAEILAISAAWPLERIEHWRILLRARAIENQLFVIAANASGTQNKIKMGGHSAVISPDGTCLIEADDSETILITEIDLKRVYTFREEIPCLKSRRPEIYNV
ncbi:MAG: carbon-nitrogen family hydrolase [Candidatus Desulfofervidus auxilii]|nr:carbon-nitrogen family hydrolase [Candidatus Desulfofervidus auxilii]